MSLCIESPVVCVCRILDVQPNRLSVGGVGSIEPLLHRRGQVAAHDFVGCIMELAVNGRPLEPSQALASRGILDRSVSPVLTPPPPSLLLPPAIWWRSHEILKDVLFNKSGRFVLFFGGVFSSLTSEKNTSQDS